MKDSLIGTYFHTLDEKGRMAVPFKLRADLGDPFYITSLTSDCLVAYPEEEWKKFTAKLDAIPQSAVEAQHLVHRVYSGATKCEPDKQGRVLLPQMLRTNAEIDKDTVIVGLSNRVEIWAKEKWHGYEESAPSDEVMMQSAAAYGIQRMEHIPVLLQETLALLNLKQGMTVVDGTLGGGGHAAAILERITPGGRLIGIDRDEFALGQAKERLKEYGNVEYVHGNFKDIKSILGMLDIKGIDGAVLDLGVSSFQIDQCNRGFSYKQDSRLDMRMNKEDKTCAADIVANYAQRDLERIFREYGEERWAARIAEFIVRERSQRPITTTTDLVGVIKKAVPSGARKDGPHPARRCFQALRIEVNGELDAIKTALSDFADVTNDGGRLAVITFHSLEDRIVKQEFRRLQNPCECPSSFPICVCGKVSAGKVVTGKPIVPTEAENEENSRAHSAKLRAFEVRKPRKAQLRW